ncbi:glycosyltransferase family 2 protein [Gluconacetobacter diazotrophicus]|uniref:Glycosyltransferase family 2 protein n=1 Tax=Gluconacetobacter diazotrophicus TaxID=33996 RepID=A0A7W4FDG2_GLUDI|nr:glycosyltransferase family A protein [Gluconacetobacter diazotrophicus]MBB2155725.1 glycosyltransferase family 2 protein [Gluconacetobacter diazotrophicus]
MLFSLVVPTLGRVEELHALLLSLTKQDIQSFEVIIVDQNDDDRLLPVIATFGDRLTIRHIRSPVRRCNHARNLGARHATGDIITFPDDDCEYPPDVLSQVESRFRTQPELGFLTGSVILPGGQAGRSGRWLAHDSAIDGQTVWTCLIEFNLFIRRSIFDAVGGFDEAIGPGTPFGSGEGQDLALRMLARKVTGFYAYTLKIIHPDKPVVLNVARAFLYGRGVGRVMRKNGCDRETVARFLVRPIGGVAVHLARFDMLVARYYLMTFLGRLAGYGNAVPSGR